jgi:NRAMP (natural resistance-associated macrophage protein)-like metal ion transporter
MGPGLITGAADDDPSGVVTYSQSGAQFGYSQLWTVLFMYPLMTAIQEVCARIGAVTGKGIAAVVRERYSRKVLYSVVTLVVLANTINIGADLGAMAAAARLVVPLPYAFFAVTFTIAILLLEILTTYRVYAKVLKWLALSLLAYPLTALIVSQPWGELLRATFVPHIELKFGFFFIIIGVLGTTITPYMFFWQASEEVEDERAAHLLNKITGIPRVTRGLIRDIRIDTIVGMLASEVTTWFIIVATATVLNHHGITNINSASDAAGALQPLVNTFPHAGLVAKCLFAGGIIGLGLLAVPVLAGSASYALSEAIGWNEGLYRKFRQAHGFYGVITLAILVGLAVNFLGINPMKALVFAAAFNGVAAVPLIFIIAKLGRDEDVMGDYRSGKLSVALVWATFVGMSIAALGLLATLIF